MTALEVTPAERSAEGPPPSEWRRSLSFVSGPSFANAAV
jgi:hypothetical protein